MNTYPDAFVRAVEEAVGRLGWELLRWDGGNIVCRDPGGRESTFGLDNVFRRARQAPPAEWPDLLAQHLANLNATKEEEDLYSVAHRLLVRVRTPFDSDEVAESVWPRPLGESGLVVTLVVDHPETMMYVNRGTVEESGRPGEEWLGEALDNLRRRTSPDMLQVVDEEQVVLLCATGEAYDAARVLVLDRLLPQAQEHGCLTVVANRDRLYLLPVRAGVLRGLPPLLIHAFRSHQEVQYPILDELLWVRGDEWHRVPVRMEDGSLLVDTPEGLHDVLAELEAGEEDAGEG